MEQRTQVVRTATPLPRERLHRQQFRHPTADLSHRPVRLHNDLVLRCLDLARQGGFLKIDLFDPKDTQSLRRCLCQRIPDTPRRHRLYEPDVHPFRVSTETHR